MNQVKFQITAQLDATPPFLLYKAVQEADKEFVILKMLSSTYPQDYALH